MKDGEVESVECLLFALAKRFGIRKEIVPNNRSKSEPGWEKAVLPGHTRDSNEYVVGDTRRHA